MWLFLVITSCLFSSHCLATTSEQDTDQCFDNAADKYINCSKEIRHFPSVCDCGDKTECYIKLEIETAPETMVKHKRMIHPYNVFRVNNGHIAPTIIAKSEAIVVVDVINKIPKGFPNNDEEEVNDDVSIHWHGMHQTNTPWMDGVGGVTQHPIASGKKFRYIFRAHPSGTHWYHSHMRQQRDQGIVGALIVRENEQVVRKLGKIFAKRRIDSIQDKPEGYMIAITEHLEETATGGVSCMPDKSSVPRTLEIIESFQINGIELDREINMDAIDTSFLVEPGESYRFRIVGAMENTELRFSIDDHKLFVVATDGYLTRPYPVDIIHFHAGERYDFVLKAKKSVESGMGFPIRIESMAVYCDDPNIPQRVGFAYLKYSNRPVTKVSRKETYYMNQHAMNCPFESYPEQWGIICHNVLALKLLFPTPRDELPGALPSALYTRFYNFNFQSGRATTNNVQFGFPTTPFVLNGYRGQYGSCSYISSIFNPNQCNEPCPHITRISKYPRSPKSVQFVFSAVVEDSTEPVSNIRTHPIHLHGHSFWVAKIAYPQYFENGTIESVNSDIAMNLAGCGPGYWSAGKPGDIRVNERTIRKDTIMVPAGGYVVIQFRSANPGWWFMHCHIDGHLSNGMGLAMDELPSCQSTPPPGMNNENEDFCISVEEFVRREETDKCGVINQSWKTRAKSQSTTADEQEEEDPRAVKWGEFSNQSPKRGDESGIDDIFREYQSEPDE